MWDARVHRFTRKSSPPPGKLLCGLIGGGSFFRYAYLPALNRKTSPISVSGVFARNADKIYDALRHLRYRAECFASLDALLESGANSVLILAPNDRHFDFARMALAKGLNVFCEKPLANSVSELLALKSAAEKSGRVLMVDFNQRYLDRNRVLKQAIGGKRIGEITSVHAYHNQDLTNQPQVRERLSRVVTGGGVVHNAAVHFINLFLYWFGEVARVNAVFENRALPKECGEDTAFCRFWFRNGIVATLDASLANAVSTSYERVEFVGAKGEIRSDLKKGDILCRLKGKNWRRITCKREVISDSVFNALQRFEQCVTTGARPETGVEDSIQTMKIVEALTLSAQRGADVQMAELEKKYA